MAEYRRPLGERAWKGTELDKANRPAVLTREEHAVVQQKLAAGVPLSAIARNLGRPLSTLQNGAVLDDDGQAAETALQVERSAAKAREREFWRQQRERDRAKGPTTVWRAPPKAGG